MSSRQELPGNIARDDTTISWGETFGFEQKHDEGNTNVLAYTGEYISCGKDRSFFQENDYKCKYGHAGPGSITEPQREECLMTLYYIKWDQWYVINNTDPKQCANTASPNGPLGYQTIRHSRVLYALIRRLPQLDDLAISSPKTRLSARLLTFIASMDKEDTFYRDFKGMYVLESNLSSQLTLLQILLK